MLKMETGNPQPIPHNSYPATRNSPPHPGQMAESFGQQVGLIGGGEILSDLFVELGIR